jgi:cytochrome c peroxidase
VVGSAFGSWFTWDGRRDSIWAQALVPFEAPDEIGASRTGVVRGLRATRATAPTTEAIFGPLPADLLAPDLPSRAGPLGDEAARAAWQRIPQARRDRIDRAYSNVGKAIEAYERTLLPGDSRFDRYVDSLRAGRRDAADLDAREIAGLRLFIDPARTQCLQCHNGPQLTNGGFHNLGTGTFDGPALDFGRALGIQAVLLDVFNCAGPYSDAAPGDCRELRFLSRDAHDPARGLVQDPDAARRREDRALFPRRSASRRCAPCSTTTIRRRRTGRTSCARSACPIASSTTWSASCARSSGADPAP